MSTAGSHTLNSSLGRRLRLHGLCGLELTRFARRFVAKSAQKHSLALLIATSHNWSQQFVSPYPDLPITTIRQCSNKNARLRFSGCGFAPESTEYRMAGAINYCHMAAYVISCASAAALWHRKSRLLQSTWMELRNSYEETRFFCRRRLSRRASPVRAVAFPSGLSLRVEDMLRTTGRGRLLRRATAGSETLKDPTQEAPGHIRWPEASTAFSGGLQ